MLWNKYRCRHYQCFSQFDYFPFFINVSSTSINRQNGKCPSFDCAHTHRRTHWLILKNQITQCVDCAIGIWIHVRDFYSYKCVHIWCQKTRTKNILQSIFTWIKKWIEKDVRIILSLFICMLKKKKRSAIGVLTEHDFSERHEILWMRIAVTIEIDTCMFVEHTLTRISYHMLERSFDKCCFSLCLHIATCERSSVPRNVLVFRLFFSGWIHFIVMLFLWAEQRVACTITDQSIHCRMLSKQFKWNMWSQHFSQIDFRLAFCAHVSNK